MYSTDILDKFIDEKVKALEACSIVRGSCDGCPLAHKCIGAFDTLIDQTVNQSWQKKQKYIAEYMVLEDNINELHTS